MDRGLHDVSRCALNAGIAVGSDDSAFQGFPGSSPTPRRVLPGAYLASVDFTQISATAPVVGCVLDAATFTHTGIVTPGRLLTLMGENLAPAQGTSGVTVNFNGQPGTLLYVSPSQINVAVPATPGGQLGLGTANMQVTVNSASTPGRVLLVANDSPALFANVLTVASNTSSCQGVNVPEGVTATILNADGTLNACANQAAGGSVVSFFLNGVGASIQTVDVSDDLLGSMQVSGGAFVTPFVYRVDVVVPPNVGPGSLLLTMRVNGVLAGPLSINSGLTAPLGVAVGSPLPITLWVKP